METSLTNFRNKLIWSGDYQPQVLFHNIADTYPLNENVACEYTLLDFDGKAEDTIFLMKTGWNSLENHEACVWAVCGEGRENLSVTFKSHMLPQDRNEFYQFCYVTTGNALCGASKVFQFCDEIPNSMVMVSSTGSSLKSYTEQSHFESHSNLQQNLAKSAELSFETEKEIKDDSTIGDQKPSNCCFRLKQQQNQIISCENEIQDLKSLVRQLITSQAAANKHMEDLTNTLLDMKNEYKKSQVDLKALEEKFDTCLQIQKNCFEVMNINFTLKDPHNKLKSSAPTCFIRELDIPFEIESLPPFPKLELPFLNDRNCDK